MSTAPAVSVILATRDGIRWIEAAMDSVSAQSFPDFEVIAVDDGSAPGTGALLQAHGEKDPRWTVVRSEAIGLGRARNLGIERARGRWLAFIDDDDLWFPSRLERQLEFLHSNPGVLALGSGAVYIGASGRKIGIYNFGPHSIAESRAWRREGKIVNLLTSSAILDARAARECGGFSGIHHAAEDVVLYNRMASRGDVLSLPDTLVQYRVHPRSVSAKNVPFQRLVFRWLEYNLREQNAGRPEIALEEFRAMPQERGRLRRLWTYRADLAAVLYRNAGGLLADRRWFLGGANLLAAFAAAPLYVGKRLLRQARPF